MNDINVEKGQNVPSSWNYGSFHLHSRLYTSFMQKDADISGVVPSKYEPLNASMKINDRAQLNFQSQESSAKRQRRASRVEAARGKLKMENIEPRKVSTSTGWQKTSKSVECPKEKVATEEYYRALKMQKEIISNSKQLELMNSKAMSFLLAGNLLYDF
jgi:hypothetical protein